MAKTTLKGKYVDSYVNDKGTRVYRYKVTGTADALASYKVAQGEFYREDQDTGDVLFFTHRFTNDNIELGIAQKSGKVYVDNSEYEKIASQVAAYGGNFGQELAKAKIAELMAKSSGANVPAQAVANPATLGNI